MAYEYRKITWFGLPRAAYILAMSSAIWASGALMSSTFQFIFFAALGAPEFAIGLLAALSAGVTALMYFIGGYIADTQGRRKVLIVYSFLSAATTFIFVFVNNWLLLVIPILLGAIAGLAIPAYNAILNDSMTRSTRARGFVVFKLVTTAPYLFAPILGGLLMARFGYLPGLRIAYLIGGATGLFAVAWRYQSIEETLNAPPAQPDRFGSFVKRVLSENLDALRRSSRNARLLLAFLALNGFASGLTTVYISIYLINGLHIGPVEYGFFTAIGAAVTMVLLAFSISLIMRIGVRRAALLAALFSPLSFLAFLSPNGMTDLMDWSISGSVSGALLGATVQSMEGDSAPKRIRGRLMAMFSIAPLIVTVPATVVAGYMYVAVSHLSPFLLSIPFYAASVVTLYLFRSRR